MKAAVSVCAEAPALSRPRLADYVELAKPRMAVLVLFTVGAGVLLASGRDCFVPAAAAHGSARPWWPPAPAPSINGSNATATPCMRRTEKRPLPSGRLQAAGSVRVRLGARPGRRAVSRADAQPHPGGLDRGGDVRSLCRRLHAAEAAHAAEHADRRRARRAAAGDRLVRACAASSTREAGVLFLILFLWQVPHFLAIAWIYRAEYARAGLCMLPVVDRDGRRTSQNMILYCLACWPSVCNPCCSARPACSILAARCCSG